MSDQDKDQILIRVEKALNDIRPHLKVDGGNVEVVELTDDYILRIRWLGNCVNCSMSTFTLKAGIEQSILQKVPQIISVEPIDN